MNLFQKHIEKYLSEYEIAVGETVPQNPEEYALIVLWNYRKIIPINSNYKNCIVFHSSDLPKGKGWAPIYYTLAEAQKYYIISGIFAAKRVDSGDIIVKAKFKMKDNYTATYLRIWDQEISIMLIKLILERYADGKIKAGKQQIGKATYRDRRYPKDNEIFLDNKLKDIVNHLRGCEKQHPAFCVVNGERYNIFIEPESKPEFPKNIEITFYE